MRLLLIAAIFALLTSFTLHALGVAARQLAVYQAPHESFIYVRGLLPILFFIIAIAPICGLAAALGKSIAGETFATALLQGAGIYLTCFVIAFIVLVLAAALVALGVTAYNFRETIGYILMGIVLLALLPVGLRIALLLIGLGSLCD